MSPNKPIVLAGVGGQYIELCDSLQTDDSTDFKLDDLIEVDERSTAVASRRATVAVVKPATRP